MIKINEREIMFMTEIWKSLEYNGVKSLYKISNTGKIKNIKTGKVLSGQKQCRKHFVHLQGTIKPDIVVSIDTLMKHAYPDYVSSLETLYERIKSKLYGKYPYSNIQILMNQNDEDLVYERFSSHCSISHPDYDLSINVFAENNNRFDIFINDVAYKKSLSLNATLMIIDEIIKCNVEMRQHQEIWDFIDYISSKINDICPKLTIDYENGLISMNEYRFNYPVGIEIYQNRYIIRTGMKWNDLNYWNFKATSTTFYEVSDKDELIRIISEIIRRKLTNDRRYKRKKAKK